MDGRITGTMYGKRMNVVDIKQLTVQVRRYGMYIIYIILHCMYVSMLMYAYVAVCLCISLSYLYILSAT